MTVESLLILVVRVAGAVIASAVDLSDLFIRDLVDLGGIPDYQRLDQWVDEVWLVAVLVVPLRSSEGGGG